MTYGDGVSDVDVSALLLEATGMTIYVVNVAHMKAVPGRKTDVHDGAPRRANRPWVQDPPWQLPSSAR
jgi:hypothetical protein